MTLKLKSVGKIIDEKGSMKKVVEDPPQEEHDIGRE